MELTEAVHIERYKVIFGMDFPDGPQMVNVMPRAMVQCFGAQMSQRSILAAYERNCAVIQNAARQKKAGAPLAMLVLDTNDLVPYL